MALAGVTYWYFGMFFGLLCLAPVLAAAARADQRAGLRRVGLGAVVCLGLITVPAWQALGGWEDLAMTDRGMLPTMSDVRLAVLPATEQFIFSQSGGLVVWATMPPDRSNCGPGGRALASCTAGRSRWRWWLAAALGGVMLMGPFLGYHGAPLLVDGKPIALLVCDRAVVAGPRAPALPSGGASGAAGLALLSRSPRPLLFVCTGRDAGPQPALRSRSRQRRI